MLSTVCVPLGKSAKKHTIIDAADLKLLAPYPGKWNLHVSFKGGVRKEYARNWNAGKPIYMHRVLLGILDKPDILGDHANGNGLDNRRSVNLRRATYSQNNHNVRRRKFFRGVYPEGRKFYAAIKVNGKQRRLGSFTEAWQAAEAYETAARQAFKFAAVTPGQAIAMRGAA